MWVIAGILLGLVLLASLVGFHSGPHAHVVAGVLGVAAAVWLLIMVVEGRSAPLLWVLLGADLVLSIGVGVMGWFGLTHRGRGIHRDMRLEGAEGVAIGDLGPDGIVSVHGEQWSARSVNGNVRAGGRVQVIRANGVHLDVWAEEPETELTARPGIRPAESKETRT
ncbi:MAG: NfeD family protein [Actinomycetota bacterium]|nr:NfeD family protein [Actinomycetota bacterium]